MAFINVDRHRGELIAILFTHSHGDHIGDMDLLREAFDVPVWGSEYTSRSVHCDRILVDGEVLQLGNQDWTVLITPGHHPGHVCLLSDAGLVAGDMVAGIGTILIPPGTGDMDVYIEQLQRLQQLESSLDVPEPWTCYSSSKQDACVLHQTSNGAPSTCSRCS